MSRKNIYNIVLTGMFISLGIALPLIIRVIPNQTIGKILLPMHIPVLLCGFICGWKFGLITGITVPLMTSLVGMGIPPIYPVAISMSFELGTYGLVTGVLTKRINVYIALIASMLAGRIVMGVANALLLGMNYSLNVFIQAAFITALPGIIIQLIIVPVLIMSLKKAGFIK